MFVYFVVAVILMLFGLVALSVSRRSRVTPAGVFTPVWKARECFSSDSAYRWFVIGRTTVVAGALMVAAGYLWSILR